VAGRIADEDVARVREASRIESVVGEHVQLRSAGGGQLKGLCPFHDEKSPSFGVTPSKGLYYCFGCGEGGDVIGFVQKLENLSFVEAVEKLAARVNIELRYEQGSASTRSNQGGQRRRIVEAHRLAVDFYAEHLATDPAAQAARTFLEERGFGEEAAKAYRCGYSPESWDSLTRHLAGRGFSREELIAAGLAKQGQRGVYDAFRNRLMFPIHDNTGEPIGFGARKLSETDQGPKYLNTGETAVYKKSHVLYGLDKARVEIGRRSQAVVVEGYTDVMACHLAGVPTAVATCGTSLTSDHIAVLRRLLMDQDELRGEVVFTFDGDSAGQKAALRAFEEDSRFVTQTFVAVEPAGLDPCELRLTKGDAAVRDLVARRQPLFEFKIRSELSRHDLDTAEGRVNALAATAPVVAAIRDRALRPEYARRLAGWLGMEMEPVLDAVRRHLPKGETDAAPRRRPAARPPDEAALRVEREALKVLLQLADLVGDDAALLEPGHFTASALAEAFTAVRAAGPSPRSDEVAAWLARVRDAAPDDAVRGLVTMLAVEPLQAEGQASDRYGRAVLARLRELTVTRRIVDLKGRLQRLNPVEEPTEYNRSFAELIALEAEARSLREQALGELGAAVPHP
jgi:DNA primase